MKHRIRVGATRLAACRRSIRTPHARSKTPVPSRRLPYFPRQLYADNSAHLKKGGCSLLRKSEQPPNRKLLVAGSFSPTTAGTARETGTWGS